MRVGLIAIQHESNTFAVEPTDLAVFKRCCYAEGTAAIHAAYASSHHEVGGMIEGMDAADIELVGILATHCTPGGTVTADTYDTLLKVIVNGLDVAGKLDGILVAPHGAGVSENEPDMDGHWLSVVREKVGPDVPIVCTLDPHANVSPRMVTACDAITIYRTNPHLDQRQRGLEAADIMARTLRGEIKPTVAAALPPIAINIERQFTQHAPCKPMYAIADAMLQRGGVISNSVILGFPYADVAELGSGFVVVTDNDQPLAQKYADELAAYLHEHRQDFAGQFISPDEAIDMAMQTEGAVCLLDMGDNVGGGSAADGTYIAHAIHKRQPCDGLTAFVSLCDPQAAQQAIDAGVGATIELEVGGKTDDLHGLPLRDTFTVRSIHDGVFTESKPRHGGRTGYSMGPTVILETGDGLTVQLITYRTPPFSLGQVTSCDLDPGRFKILIAKGVNAPVAAYEEVCSRFIRVNTPGSTCADMTQFTFNHRRNPLFPFEAI